MNIWHLCDGAKKITHITTDAWRVVEDQARSSTRCLVDSLEEHDILEHEIDSYKPEISPLYYGLHYLLFTPFRYPPLKHGSRFGKRTAHSLWYGSCELITALAENAYYRFVFLQGSEMGDATDRVSKTAFSVKVAAGQGIDLTVKPFVEHKELISSPMSWQQSQALGEHMRREGVQAFKYYSSRDVAEGINVALFTPHAFKSNQPARYKAMTQFSTRAVVEYIDAESQDKYAFKIDDFMINDAFPLPSD